MPKVFKKNVILGRIDPLIGKDDIAEGVVSYYHCDDDLKKRIDSGGGGGEYTLPTASETTKGGIKVGDGLSMNDETMSVKVSGNGGLKIDKTGVSPGLAVKVANGLITDVNGLSVLTDDETIVKDGSSNALKVSDNANLKDNQLATASADVKGGVKVGEGLAIDEDGVLSTTGGGGESYTGGAGIDISEDNEISVKCGVNTDDPDTPMGTTLVTDEKGLWVATNPLQAITYDAMGLKVKTDDETIAKNNNGNLTLAAAYQNYIKQLEDRIAALEAIVNPHSVTITCDKTSVPASGGVVNVTLSDDFEATEFTLTCDKSFAHISGSGKNYTLTFDAHTSTSSRSATITATAIKGDLRATATKTLTQQAGESPNVTIDCKSSVSAGGETISIVVENNFEATDIQLTCTEGSTTLTPQGSGKNWTLTIPIAVGRAHHFILTATASKHGGISATTSKTITQPKAEITINCSKTSVSASGETITVGLMNNFGQPASMYQLTTEATGVTISPLGGGSFSVVIGAHTGTTARTIKLVASTVVSLTTIQAEANITQQGSSEQAYDCWIGHAGDEATAKDYNDSINRVIQNNAFKQSLTSSSARKDYTVQVEDWEKIVMAFPKSFNITPANFYEGAFQGGVEMTTKVINDIEYNVLYSSAQYPSIHNITIK